MAIGSVFLPFFFFLIKARMVVNGGSMRDLEQKMNMRGSIVLLYLE